MCTVAASYAYCLPLALNIKSSTTVSVNCSQGSCLLRHGGLLFCPRALLTLSHASLEKGLGIEGVSGPFAPGEKFGDFDEELLI